ncbi:MAG: DUF111 family protein, partial [Acidobacteria bacterium]|nr:DUF111 family protein [Acidobacteriota bacterium]
MKIAYFDAFSGIAGDMTVASLIDAGADAQALFTALDSLATGARFSVEKTKRAGIAATSFHIAFEDQKKHRHLPHIVKMIEAAALPDPVKANAIAVFNALGAAEARVHGTTIEKVHFHEVGAVDSICDIVLLAGKPVFARGPETELTTPTGAAIVAALARSCGPLPAMNILNSGFGAGSKDFPGMANVLRVLIGETTAAPESTLVSVIEANIDDSSPEILGYAMERLLEAGALDVTLQPVFMKKQRPATLLQVIARPEDQERLADVLFSETSTLGLRITHAERRVQPRTVVQVETPYGPVRVKLSPGGAAAPEFEDCRRLAAQSGLPLKEIYAAALRAPEPRASASGSPSAPEPRASASGSPSAPEPRASASGSPSAPEPRASASGS